MKSFITPRPDYCNNFVTCYLGNGIPRYKNCIHTLLDQREIGNDNTLQLRSGSTSFFHIIPNNMFRVICEAWSTHRDHVSVGIVGGVFFVVRVVTLLVSDRYLLNGCINFIQTLQKGKASLNIGQVRMWRSSTSFFTELWLFLLRLWLNCCF